MHSGRDGEGEKPGATGKDGPMANDDSSTQQQPDAVQAPTEGGTGTAETDEGATLADERQAHAEGGAGQQGRGRVQ